MSDPRTVIIINPAAQNGSLGRRWPEMAATVRRGLAFEEAKTAGPGDATRLAREAIAGGADRVIAVGGDGTLNEVVNGFVAEGDPNEVTAGGCALGLIPFGTGGDFRKTLRIPKDIEAATAIIAEGRTQSLDLGVLEYTTANGDTAARAFINIASFGLSGLVDELVNEGSKRLGGRLSFMLATARAGLRYTNQRVSLTFDDEPEAVDLTISTVAVANGRYFGGGMHIAPEADPNDGFFDVVALGDMTTADFLLRGHRLYRGTHLSMDKVSSRRARKVRAEPAGDRDPVRIDLDGETPGRLPATFSIAPSAIDFLVA